MRKTKTFKQTMIRALVTPVMITLCASAGFTITQSFATYDVVPGAEAATAGPSYPEQLAKRHNCQEPVEGVIPTGVILADPADAATPIFSRSLVGPALDQLAFDGVIDGAGADHGIATVYKFCR